MSEYKPGLETHNSHEKLVDDDHAEKLEKHLLEKAEHAKNEKAAEDLDHLLKAAETHAEASENITIDNQKDDEPDTALGVQQLLKSDAYQHTLRGIQQKLPKPARLFSKLAHSKTIDAISETSAHTVARPSGLLGGSVCAFIGSVVLLYYSRHYGFTYNYALFILLFVAGFLIGIVGELAIWSLYSRRHHR